MLNGNKDPETEAGLVLQKNEDNNTQDKETAGKDVVTGTENQPNQNNEQTSTLPAQNNPPVSSEVKKPEAKEPADSKADNKEVSSSSDSNENTDLKDNQTEEQGNSVNVNTDNAGSGSLTAVTPPAEPLPEEPQPKAVEYIYRSAKQGDDYYLHNEIKKGDIVIIGVKYESQNGVYEIPSTIDGKRVTAVMGGAFSEVAASVKEIILPASVITVKDGAFSECINLSDLYIYGGSVYIGRAFAAPSARSCQLTIHCSDSCNDRDGSFYKDIASSYFFANYEEWQG